MSNEQKTFTLKEIFSPKDAKDLEAYVSFHIQELGTTGIHRAVGDFCASRIEIMQRIKDHGFLFSYFCYLVEGLFTGAIKAQTTSASVIQEPKNQETQTPAPKTDEPKS